MSSRKGAIAGFNVEQSLKRLERNPLAVRGSDFRGGRTPYDELSVNLKVTERHRPRRGRADRDAGDAGRRGGLLLDRGRAISTSRAPPACSAGGASTPFQLPFVVMGTWDDPLFWPDIQMLIRRSGAAAPLLDAVRNRLNREAGTDARRRGRPGRRAARRLGPATTRFRG